MSLNLNLMKCSCSEIEISLSRLELFQKVSRDEFIANQDTLDLACYRLLVAIESALQICYHITAKKLGKIPEEYAECFAILCQEGIIDDDLSKNLQQMARFRNLLIHVYWKINYKQLYDIIQNNLGDLRAFVRAISKQL
jgi:uncharacterized protein YutE (UPF0331/DUF86 family)